MPMEDEKVIFDLSMGQNGAVKSAKRTVQVLEALSESNSSLSLSAINKLLGIPKSSLHGILRTLIESGWVNFNSNNNSYSLGLKSLRVGARFLDQDKLINMAGPLMSEFRDKVGETINLGRFDGFSMIYLASFESSKNLRKYTRIGRSLPAYATSLGKQVLSNFEEEKVINLYSEPLVRITNKTVPNVETLLTELRTAKKNGWNVEYDQSSVGFSCISVAVNDRFPPINALSVSMRTSTVNEKKIEKILPDLMDASNKIQNFGF